MKPETSECEKPNDKEKVTNEKTKPGRTLTTQEESILLPLLQGLLAAGGGTPEDVAKAQNKTGKLEKKPNKVKKSVRLTDTEQGAKSKKIYLLMYIFFKLPNLIKNALFILSFPGEESSNENSNILLELATALNRLQKTLLEEKDVVTDTRKRNTILTLVAWLKRVLQTPSSDNSGIDAQLTDLLPTELLLSKLMPQLPGASPQEPPAPPERTAASSKRFQKQRNNRYNTVGVSKEELADARLYLQKKLLSENLTTNGTSGTSNAQTSLDLGSIINDDSEDIRRKSLSLRFSNDFSEEIDHIFDNSKNSFSKSIDLLPSKEDLELANVTLKHPCNGKQQLTNNMQAKNAFRRKESFTGYNPIYNPINGSIQNNNSNNGEMNLTTDTEDDMSEKCQTNSKGNQKMNKFALKKLKMKRANTIDIPSTQSGDDDVTYTYTDGVSNMSNHKAGNDYVRTVNQANSKASMNNRNTGFQPRTFAFLNKQASESHPAWVNADKSVTSPQLKTSGARNNWTNKFDNIKNAFEKKQSVSPIGNLNTKNNFTHAPTSPFMPVNNTKAPLTLSNGHKSSFQQNKQIYAQNAEPNQQFIQNAQIKQQQYFEQKPQLKSYKSMPSPSDIVQDANGQVYTMNAKSRANAWANQHASVDSASFNTASNNMPTLKPAIKTTQPDLNYQNHLPYTANPLYIPVHNNVKQKADLINIQTQNQNLPSQQLPYSTPSITPVSPHTGEFPAYTYTCTDYTQPTCVSTYVPNDEITPTASPSIPDNIQPMKSLQPPLAATRLNRNMKTVDYTSSSEYLSEPNRSPQPFYITANMTNDQPMVQEFTAKTQIMKYPQCQTATVINKPRRYSGMDEDEQQRAKNLHKFLTNKVTEGQPIVQYNNTYIPPEYNDSQSYDSDGPQMRFIQPKPTYIAPIPPYNPNAIRNGVNQNEHNTHLSNQQYIQSGTESIYGSQNLPISQHRDQIQYQPYQQKIEPPLVQQQSHQKQQQQQKQPEKSKQTSAVKVNNYGGQYIAPKLVPNFQGSKIRVQKRQQLDQHVSSSLPGHVLMNNVANLARSNTINQRRIPPPEIKRKQSLPAQGTEFSEEDEPKHNYLPTGVLKRSKSGHTLALLQQFESRDHPEPPPPPLRQSQPALNKTVQRPPTPKQVQPAVVKPAPQPPQVQPKPKLQIATKQKAETPPKTILAPKIIQTPSTPQAERPKENKKDEEEEEKPLSVAERIQNFTQTINARNFNKTFDEDDLGFNKGGVQKSKSGSLLSIPKQYETIIKKSEVQQKERTVAAYFSGSKSPQGLQRSSSQHSMLKSKSLKELTRKVNANDDDDDYDDDNDTDDSIRHSKTVTKSAHHLKILKKQRKETSNIAKSQTMPNVANLLDESNVDDAFEDLFLSFNK